jgi:xyloglucan-specific exo-beta-1,4-glucanase
MKNLIRNFFTLGLLFALWNHSQAQPLSFGTVTFGGGGYVDGIIACPTQTNLFYCKTDVGGAYRWDETNQAWVALLDWCSPGQTTYQGAESLAIDPSTPQNLYLFVGTSYWNGDASAILRSTNYGATFAITDTSSQFKASGNGGNRQKGEELAVDPNLGSILFCGSRANGLFQSINSGVTWTAVTSFNTNIVVANNNISFVQFDKTTGTPGNPTQRIFVGVYATNANVFMSTNAGVNWTALAGSPSNSWPERCALAGNNQLYITYGNDPDGAIMKYTTTNGVWASVTPARGTLTYCGISASVSNPQLLVASTYDEYKFQPWGPYGDLVFISTNGGTSWVDIFGSGLATESGNGYAWAQGNQINWAGVTIDPFNPNRVFTGSGNGLYCTTNLNYGLTSSSWKFMVKNLEETVPIAFISVPGGPFITSIGDYGGIVSTNVAVPALTAAISQSTSFAYAAQQSNFIARVVANGNLLYAKQTPVTWTPFYSMPAGMSNGYVAISASGSTVLWKSSSCCLTTNLGTNWTASTGLTFTCALQADSVNSAKFYAYNSANGFLYVSTNGGLNFNQAGSAGTGGATIFCATPGFEGHVWIAMNNSGLKYSTNSGATFNGANVSVCNALAFGKAAPGANYPTLYIWGQPTSGSTTGMYRSTDQGVTWLRVNDNNHQYGGLGNAGIIEADKNVYGRAYMSTVGRGVPYVDSAVNVTNVTMSPPTFSTFVTGTQQLTAAALPANATYPSITWASSNSAIATVNAAGFVTANAAGTTTITATTLDGNFVAGSVVTVTNLLTSPLLTFAQGDGTSMNLSWPADHRGWLLQIQTNSLNAGLGTNWFTVPSSAATNQINVSPNPANGSAFYRLVSP